MAWCLAILVFLVVFIVTFLLNMHSFTEMKKELNADAEGIEYEPLVLREDLLGRAVVELEEKWIVFENGFLLKPDIKDPY